MRLKYCPLIGPNSYEFIINFTILFTGHNQKSVSREFDQIAPVATDLP